MDPNTATFHESAPPPAQIRLATIKFITEQNNLQRSPP